jgi:hypothetical protein
MGRGVSIPRNHKMASDEDFAEHTAHNVDQIEHAADSRIHQRRNLDGSVCHSTSPGGREDSGIRSRERARTVRFLQGCEVPPVPEQENSPEKISHFTLYAPNGRRAVAYSIEQLF